MTLHVNVWDSGCRSGSAQDSRFRVPEPGGAGEDLEHPGVVRAEALHAHFAQAAAVVVKLDAQRASLPGELQGQVEAAAGRRRGTAAGEQATHAVIGCTARAWLHAPIGGELCVDARMVTVCVELDTLTPIPVPAAFRGPLEAILETP